jgi:hypothetical protein
LLTVGAGLFALPLFVPWRDVLARRALIGVGVPLLASMALLLWYNQIRFGSLFVFGYGPNDRYDTPLVHGLNGLLFSPGTGLFVYNPLTIIGVVGVALLVFGPKIERDYALALLVGLLTVPRMLFFAKWHGWWGGDTWGPRFLLPVVALLSLMIVPVLRCSRTKIARAVTYLGLAVLVLWGGFVSFLSARVPLGEWLSKMASPAARAQLGIHGASTAAQQFDALHFKWSTSPIGGFLTLMRRHMAASSADLWAYGHADAGYAIVAVGLLCLLLTFVAAVRFRDVGPATGSPANMRSPDPGAHSEIR